MNKQVVIGTFVGLLLTAAVGYYFFVSKATQLPAGAVRGGGKTADPINLPVIDLAEGYSLKFEGREDLIAHTNATQPYLTPDAWDKALSAQPDPRFSAVLRLSNDCAGLPPTSGLTLAKSTVDAIRLGKQNVIVLPKSLPKCFARDSFVALAIHDPTGEKIAYDLAGRLKIERLLEARVDFLPDTFFTALKISRDHFSLMYNLGGASSTFIRPIFVLLVAYEPNSPVLAQDILPNFTAGAEVLSVRDLGQFATRIAPAQSALKVFVDTREPKYFATDPLKNSPLGPPFKVINAPFIPSNPLQSKFRPDFLLADLAGSKVDLTQIPAHVDIPLILFGHDEHDAGPLWVLRELRLRPHRDIVILREGAKPFSGRAPPVQK